jgi:hypothetical protein
MKEANMLSNSVVPAPQRLLNLSVGLASPLWPTFYVAATAGLAIWSLGALLRNAGVAVRGVAPSVPTVPDMPELRESSVPVPVPVPVASPAPETADVVPPEPVLPVATAIVPEPDAVLHAGPVANPAPVVPKRAARPRAAKGAATSKTTSKS